MAAAFQTGTRVILHGLKMRPDYNGHTGVVVHPVDSQTGRCLVKLCDGEECSLRPENLEEAHHDYVQQSVDSQPSISTRIGSRVVLHSLVAQPHYNARVGIVIKPAQPDTVRCLVKLCNGGEEVTVRSENVKHASDAIWSAAATGADAAVEVVLKAVSFLSKFSSPERCELIAKMQKKDKFQFMREGASMHAYFLERLQDATRTEEPKDPCAAAQTQVVLAPSDSRSYSSPNDPDNSGAHPVQPPTFPFRWGKGQAHCVENEEFDASCIDEPSDEVRDAELLQSEIFGSDPPKIFPVDASTELGRWELCSRGIARRLMQMMGFDFSRPAGLGLTHQGPITPIGVSHRPKGGQEFTKNPGLGLAECTPTHASSVAKAVSLVGANRALESVAIHSHKHEPVRVVGRKTARESNEQILIVAEMLKQKEAALLQLSRAAKHHPEQLKHLVSGKIHHVQSEVDDLKRAAEEAMRVAQNKSANKKLKKVCLHVHFALIKRVLYVIILFLG